nr:beta-microseminoprotein-like [Pelodiscus sinensis]|eukprot:XP_006118214.1 beta-microseminoprotein-like [Pelodiscus sinensis]
MYFLHLQLAFLIPMTLSSAQCFHKNLVPRQVTDKGCRWDSETHAFNIYWYTDYCLRCICDREMVSCCNITPIPADYDRENCEEVYEESLCTYLCCHPYRLQQREM